MTFLALFVLLADCWCFGLFCQDEPFYQDKPLRHWLELYQAPMDETGEFKRAADGAVQQIGTNAIPILLRMIQAKDSKFCLLIMRLSERHGFVHIRFNAEDLNVQAGCAFSALGERASNAVAALLQVYDQPPSLPSKREAANALGSIGKTAKAAIPSFLKNIASPTWQIERAQCGHWGESLTVLTQL